MRTNLEAQDKQYSPILQCFYSNRIIERLRKESFAKWRNTEVTNSVKTYDAVQRMGR